MAIGSRFWPCLRLRLNFNDFGNRGRGRRLRCRFDCDRGCGCRLWRYFEFGFVRGHALYINNKLPDSIVILNSNLIGCVIQGCHC